MKNRLITLLFFCTSCLIAQNGIEINAQVSEAACNQCNGALFLSATGGTPPYSYFWSNGATPTVVSGLCPGAYTVTVSDVQGLTATETFYITSSPTSFVEVFSFNQLPCNSPDSNGLNQLCEKVCPNSIITYAAEVANASGQIFWLVNGEQSFTPGPNNTVTVTWGAPGTGSVSVSPDSPTGGPFPGCLQSNTICVTIVEEPKAKISSVPMAVANVITVCKGQTVYFQNLSDFAESYEWTFSDDQSLTLDNNPAHIYNTPGNYEVQLIARSACLCADTTKLSVTVLDSETPKLDCVGTVCPGAKVTYTATGGCAPYSWNVSGGSVLGGGSANTDTIAVEWNDVAFGLVTFNAQSCSGASCPVPAVLRVPIISDNAEIKGRDRVCQNAEEYYSIEAYGGANFEWKLLSGGQIVEGQGTNRVLVRWTNPPSTTLSHILRVTYDNCYLGCSGVDEIAVKILAPFVISGPLEACDKNSPAGLFYARLTTNNTLVSCNWTLYAPNGSAVWTGNNQSSVNLPAFTNGPGFYRLFAVPVSAASACTDQAEWSVHVLDLPKKPLGIKGEKKICPNTSYAYEAMGLASNENVRWTVKNGPGVTLIMTGNPLNVTWGANGPYWISAAAVSTNGLNCLSDTSMMTIQALGIPDIAGVPTLCEDSKGYYSTPPLKNLDFKWSISPASAGAIADGQGTEGVHIFWSQPGGHVVNLDVCGQTNQFPVTVLANPDPMVTHPAALCPGDQAMVQTTAGFSAYVWKNEAGGVISALPAPALGPGTYALEVTDGIGCKGVTAFSIEENPIPILTISTLDPTGFCNNSRFVLMKALVTNDGDYSYQWYRNGVAIPGATNQTYNTNQYGDYTCRAVNQFGCAATAGPINVFQYCGGGVCHNPNHAPKCLPGDVALSIVPSARCDSFQFNLIPGPLYKAGSAIWHFGESGANYLGSSTSNNPKFVFPDAGQYIVVLYAELTNGATCTLLDSVKVNAVADFDLSPACPGSGSNFKDVSAFLAGSGGISSWNWNFGDPGSGVQNTGNVPDPSHVFANTGNYTVSLTITAASGCTSSATRITPVPVLPLANFPLPAVKCSGNALEFSLNSSTGLTDVQWNFGDPASGAANDAGSAVSYHNYSAPGPYSVTATVSNVYGCTASATKVVNIAPNPLSGTITPANPTPVCEGSYRQLTAPLAAFYKWSDDNNSITNSINVYKEGVYKVTLTDANGCTFVPPPVKVEVTPSPDGIVKGLVKNDLGQVVGYEYPAQMVCQGEDVILQTFSGNFVTYNWSGLGNSNALEFTEDRWNLLAPGVYNYTVIISDVATGCTATLDPFQVTVNPKPADFTIISNGYCAGTPNTISLIGAPQANTQYIWNTGQSGVSISTADPGRFLLRAINQFGCENRSPELLVRSGPQVSSIPGGCHTRCEPDTLCLPNIPNIVSWQWFFNGTAIPGATTANFVATQSGTYHASLSDAYGCKAQSDPLSLSLYTGFGSIAGKVWSDVNHNGLIDGPDTLVSNVGVFLNNNGNNQSTAISDANGSFTFPNILSTGYSVEVDPASLPVNWKVVIGQANVVLSGCDDLEQAGLLIDFDCQGGVVKNLTLQACPGGNALFNGIPVSTGTTQSFAFALTNGCDSTVNVSVQPYPTSTGTLTLKACPGGNATYAGTPIATGSSQNFALQNYLGCDSILTVSVQPYATSTSALTLRTCPGESVLYNGFNIAAGATQVVKLVNFRGCDSLVTVTVQANPTYTKNENPGVCAGQSYNYHGTIMQAGETRTFDFKTWLGCDSTVVVSVKSFASPSNTLNVNVCPGEKFEFDGQSLGAGTTKTFKYTTTEGCDSIITVVVNAYPDLTFQGVAKASCGNAATGVVEAIAQTGGTAPFVYSLDNQPGQPDPVFTGLTEGDYTLTVEDANGCQWKKSVQVDAIPRLQVALTNGFLPCDSSGLRIEAQIQGGSPTDVYRWHNGDSTRQTKVYGAGPISLEVKNACETVRAEASVEWSELASDFSIVYVPNIFAPQARESSNAQFKPHFAAGLSISNYRLAVYDRWGNMLFETKDLGAGWEGAFRSKIMEPGVMVWHLEADVAVCGRIIKVRRKGDITVYR